jgi:hypothetical protein
MGKQEAKKHLLGSVRETLEGDRETDCALELYLLLLYIRMGCGNQHYAFHLPYPSLQFRIEANR